MGGRPKFACTDNLSNQVRSQEEHLLWLEMRGGPQRANANSLPPLAPILIPYCRQGLAQSSIVGILGVDGFNLLQFQPRQGRLDHHSHACEVHRYCARHCCRS